MAITALGGDGDLFVAANAPERGSDLSVLIGVDPGVLGACEGTAEVEIELNGILAYPSVYGRVPIEDCQGSIQIPYARFASENALYLVRARFDGKEDETRVMIEKVVEWVYIRAFSEPEAERVRVDAALDSVRGQPLSSGIFATGTLVLDVRWETCTPQNPLGLPVALPTEQCRAQRDLVFHAVVPVESRASSILFIPFEGLRSAKFEDGRATEGWYNVTATFHNDEAKGNYNVPMDPSVYQEDPPGNWFEVSYP